MSSGVISGLLYAAIIVGLWFLGRAVSKRRSQTVADRPDFSYAPYTRDFDLNLSSAQLPKLLAEDGIAGEVPRGSTMDDLDVRRERFEAAVADARGRVGTIDTDLSGQAVCFLLDLSGSMAPRLPEVLGELRAIHERSLVAGASSAVLGFTTRGWQGGLARKKWQAAGRPPYPGRLCALLHLEIAGFGEFAGEGNWHALLRPDALRENVDGEAIRWAASLLAAEPRKRRRLIVLSDGAPVDDSTLAENGPSYLFCDLRAAIREIESASQIELAGVGLSHHVDALYRTSGNVDEGANLTAVLLPLLLDSQRNEGGE